MIATQEKTETAPLATALYVGDLNPDVTETTLYNHFGGEGVVTSTKVCRDMTTKRSLGYAYVNFRSLEDAKNAIDQLNYTMIMDRPCRIMWSVRDPAKRKDNRGNLYIKNIDRSVDTRTVHQAFTEFGDILSFKIATDDFGNSKGYGFIHFSNEESAKKVMSCVNGLNFKGKKLVVCPFVPRSERAPSVKEGQFNNVFVKNFVNDFTEESLLKKFSEKGKITSSYVPKDENNNLKGFAFVCFEKPENAASAVETLNGLKLKDGTSLYVRQGLKKNERAQELLRIKEERRRERYAESKNNNLYVKNLPETVTDETLKSLFSKFGNITSCRVMRDEAGNSRKFGFVCFETQEQAARALALNNTLVDQRAIYVAIAQSKDERRYQLAYRFSQMKIATNVSQVRMVPPQPAFPQFPPGAIAQPGPDMRQFRHIPPERAHMMRGGAPNPMFMQQFNGPQGYMQSAPRHIPPSAYMGGAPAATQMGGQFYSRMRTQPRGPAQNQFFSPKTGFTPVETQQVPQQRFQVQQHVQRPGIHSSSNHGQMAQINADQGLTEFLHDIPKIEDCQTPEGKFLLPKEYKKKIGHKLLQYASLVCGEQANTVVGVMLSRPSVLNIINSPELIKKNVATTYDLIIQSKSNELKEPVEQPSNLA